MNRRDSMEDDFITEEEEYCRLVTAYYINQIRQQQNPDVPLPWEDIEHEEEDSFISFDDLASEDGMANYDAWEEDQIHNSWMYEAGYYSAPEDIAWEEEIENFQDDTEYEVIWEEMHPDLENEGLPEDKILKNMKTRRSSYVKEDEPEMCVVCQLEYEDNETLGILGCGHEYHADCIKRWLLQKNVCPLCKETAIVL